MLKLPLLKLPVLFGLIMAACSNQGSVDSSSYPQSAPLEVADMAYTDPTAPIPADHPRKIIRDGSISFESSDLAETGSLIRSEVKQLGGYISNENTSSSEYRKTINLTARIPEEHFDGLIQKLSDHAKSVEYTHIYTEDVTEQFIDVEARMLAKKELEARYLDLLKQAKNVEELLSIERELATVRADIESMEGRLNYLRNRSSMSTLQISFYEKGSPGFGFVDKVKEGLYNGWKGLQWFLVFLVNIWPFILIVSLLLFYLLRKKKNLPPPL